MNLLSAPLYVAWDATYKCNLRCIHCCFGDRNNVEYAKCELTTAEAKRMLQDLADMKVLSLQFAGGEPLVRDDIDELISFSANMPYSRSIATNGLLITDHRADLLRDAGICSVQISLDGPEKELHEQIRGKGTFETTIESIKRLVKRNIPVSVAVLVSRHNAFSMGRMVRYLSDLGVTTLRLQFLLPEGNAQNIYNELYLESLELKEIVDEVSDSSLVKDGKLKLQLPCFYTSLLSKRENVPVFTSKYITNSCGAGTCTMNISACGDITACGLLTDESWSCGNIREQSIAQIWQSDKFDFWRKPMTFEGKCKNCEIINTCHGGCRASAYLIGNNILAGDPLCWR